MSATLQWMMSQYAAKGGKVFTFDRGSSAQVAGWKATREERRLFRMRQYGSRKLKVAIRRTERAHGRFITEDQVLTTMSALGL